MLALSLTLALAAAPAADRSPDAVALVRELSAGKARAARARFARVMLDALPEPALASAWKSVEERSGALKSLAGTRQLVVQGFDVVLVRAEFEGGPLDVRVVFDAAGKVAGLFFVPSGQASDYRPLPGGKAVEAPKPPAGVREVEVVVGQGGAWPLPGTLTLPGAKGAVPAVVLVHGSGPNDRDEAVGGSRPFRDLAWGLAERGVAVLRYEKRSRAHGPKVAALKQLTVKDEVVDDAVLAAALLRGRKEVDPAKVFVLGHSLGGYLVPRIGAADPKLRGLVALAGSTRPLEDLVVEQTRYLGGLGPVDEAGKAKLQALEAEAKKVKSVAKDTPGLVLGAPASYWLDLAGYDPVAEAKKLTQPLLVLQGGRDYQVTEADFARWKALEGTGRATLKLYPKLNHLFVTGEGKSRPDEYAAEGHVAAEVLDDVAAWVKERSR